MHRKPEMPQIKNRTDSSYQRFSRSFLSGSLCHFLLIIVIGVAIYANTINAPFLFDDLPCIAKNKAISTYFDTSIPQADKYAGLAPDVINSMDSRKVVYFTFALNYLVHGYDVSGYHIVNLLIHLAAALAVYILISTLFRTPFFITNPVNRSVTAGLPLVIALLFVSHPIQSSAVTYIIQRFTSLATLVYLLSITLYLKARIAENRRDQMILLAASVSVAAVGMFTKETVFTLPVIAIICEVLFLRGKWSKRILFLVPLLSTLLIIPFNMLSQIDLQAPIIEVLDDSVNLANLNNISQQTYFLTQLRVMLTYLRLMVLPIDQQLDYFYPQYHSLFEPPVVMSALFLVGIIISAVWAYRKSLTPSPAAWNLRLYSFGIAWFFITISVSSSIIPLNDMLFEYRLYLPSTGFFIAASALVLAAMQKLELSGFPVTKAAPVATVMIVVVLCIATISRNYVWRDPIRFWEDNIAKSPMKRRPHKLIAIRYVKTGNLKEAIDHKLAMIQLAPDNPDNFKIWNDIAVHLVKLERYDEALEAIDRSIALKGDDPRLQATYKWVLSIAGQRIHANGEPSPKN